MKTLILIMVVLTLSGLTAESLSSRASLNAWHRFKAQFNKTYANPEEEELRMGIFLENYRIVQAYNSKPKGSSSSTHSLRINDQSDRTQEEWDRLSGYRELDFKELQDLVVHSSRMHFDRLSSDAPLPDFIDWSKNSSVNGPVRCQGKCGSCWAMATVGFLEAQQHFDKPGIENVTPLSPQNLVDCVTKNLGCEGGTPLDALVYAYRYGLNTEEDYPYEGKDTNGCRFKPNIAHHIAYHGQTREILRVNASSTETLYRYAIANYGPIIVGMSTTCEFRFHGEGVFLDERSDCKKLPVTHAVLIVGYGTDPDQGDYWIIKNSWGTTWGEGGYAKIARNRNTCNIETIAFSSSPGSSILVIIGDSA